MTDSNQHILLKAINYAAIAHTNQRRKDAQKSPYINHPVGVMYTLSSIGITDITTLCTAVLHDTVEDTDTTYNDLVNEFGKSIADTVMECTDDKSLPASKRKQLQIEHVTSGLMSQAAKLVKLSDKLYNLRDIIRSPPGGWSVERIQGYFIWAQQVTTPIQHINQQLSDMLNTVYQSKFILNGVEYDCIPKTDNTQQLLHTYYKSLDK